MNSTSIEWCDKTLNPVVGCTYNCPYCYARKMNDRFKFVEDFSKPKFFPERLSKLKKVHGCSVFMNSMSDIADWDRDTFLSVMDACENNPENSYLFLTKRPWQLREFVFPSVWIGATITNQYQLPGFLDLFGHFHRFVSIEPLLGPLLPNELKVSLFKSEWVIIGAETGNRKGRVAPEKEWIDNIVSACDDLSIPVFMKDSLIPIVDEMRRDYPKGLIRKGKKYESNSN